MRRVAVFCGAARGARESYAQSAAQTGELLARRGLELVFGGGRVGLMGAVADGALRAGGRVIGVIPAALVARELAHQGAQDLRVVRTMHERKALMAELADGFLALPGGFGTLDEFCEILTWAQLGLHAKPCALLNIEGYYDPFLQMLERGVAEGFIPSPNRDWVIAASDPEALLEAMARFTPPSVPKWISPRDA